MDRRLRVRYRKLVKAHMHAALAGLFVLLPVLELLHDHGGDLSQLRDLVAATIPFIDTG